MKEAAAIAQYIRERSKAGELVGLADLEAGIAGQTASDPDWAVDPSQLLALVVDAVSSHDDLEAMVDDSGGAWYFSQRFMTGAYARILLLKREGPVKMMAAVIREHSRLYPRPVPLALFQCPPFNLSNDQIRFCLKIMVDEPAYRDIAQVTTSIGNLFVYSTGSLDPKHAAMLAEWADVGQVGNP